MAVGSVLAVLQQQPVARFTAASTASFLMLAGCFAGEPPGSQPAPLMPPAT